jgi:hypothetical protein
MPGIWVVDGGDLRLSDIRFSLGADEPPSSPTIDLRIDMWRHWLAEAVSAAIEAADIAPKHSPELLKSNSEEAGRIIIAELRASMRAMTSAAFAIDAFYASVKARSAEHPQQAVWDEKATPRNKQVASTLRHHLKITKNEQAKELSKRVQEMFRFRDWAVHPGSRFRKPEYREDVDAFVDWHFVAFRASNAVAGVGKTVELLDFLVAVLDRGSDELVKWKPGARRSMNQILDAYEASDKLHPIGRVEPAENGDDATAANTE